MSDKKFDDMASVSSVFLERANKFFGPHQILFDLTLSVRPGEIVGLLGPNGSGKTTALRCIAGYYAIDSGTVSVCGEPVGPQGLAARRLIGYLPEKAPLYDSLSVNHYLEFVAQAKAIPRSARKPAIERAMRAFDLNNVRNKAIGRLSKGFRQRVGLAQAVLNDPPVLLLDESTNGLDPLQIVEAREMIRSSASGRAVIFSSHLMQEIESLCTRVVMLRQGHLVSDSPLSHGLMQSKDEYISLTMANCDPELIKNALLVNPCVVSVDVHSLHTGGQWQLRCHCADNNNETFDFIVRTVISLGQLIDVRRSGAQVEAALLDMMRAH
jgi:ABC-2 type transport system ATP-binding protein